MKREKISWYVFMLLMLLFAFTMAFLLVYNMDFKQTIASFAGRGSNLYWYDRGNFSDTTTRWKTSCLPVFLNYINGTGSFDVIRTDIRPELSGQVCVLFLDPILEYEGRADYSELSVTMLHVYYRKARDD